MRSLLSWLGKALIAGLLALALLCLFCFFYYNVPVHYPNPDGATEYKWEPSRFTSRGTEGFAITRSNNDGFNNLFDFTPGDPIDILLMGSSHMEGFNTPQRYNTAAVLNDLFAGDKTVYNIGTAGHTLLYNVEHLPAALDHYAPGQYVIIETDTLNYAPTNMDAAADGTLPEIPSHTGTLITLLQKLPFLRLIYTKYFNVSAHATGGESTPIGSDVSPAVLRQAMGRLVGRMAEAGAAHGVQAILLYHPAFTLQPDGSAVIGEEPALAELMSAVCEEQGVLFVDTRDQLLTVYREQALLPTGFSNTAPGTGHINALGHRLIAEALYAAITAQEG